MWVSGRDYGITCDVVEYTNGALPPLPSWSSRKKRNTRTQNGPQERE